jgi:hypothetical protein
MSVTYGLPRHRAWRAPRGGLTSGSPRRPRWRTTRCASVDLRTVRRDSGGTAPLRDHLNHIHHFSHGVFAFRGEGSGGFMRSTPRAHAPPGQLENLRDDPTEQHDPWRQQPDFAR